MKLALKFTAVFLIGMCLVLGVYAYVISRREIAFFEKDSRRDQRALANTLALAVRTVWDATGQAQAMDLISRENNRGNHEGMNARWVWVDAPAGDPQASRLPPDKLHELRSG